MVPAARQACAASAPRTFVSCAPVQAGVTETIKQAAQKVNKVAGDAVLNTITASENLADSAKPVMEQAKEAAEPLVGKAQEVSSTRARRSHDQSGG